MYLWGKLQTQTKITVFRSCQSQKITTKVMTYAKFQYAQAITRTTEISKRLPVVRYKVVSKQVYSVKVKIVSRTQLKERRIFTPIFFVYAQTIAEGIEIFVLFQYLRSYRNYFVSKGPRFPSKQMRVASARRGKNVALIKKMARNSPANHKHSSY